MAVITLSRQFGSGGDEIAQLICREMGYQMFDKQMLAMAAMEAGLTEDVSTMVSENDYRVAGFLDRLLGRQEPAAEVRVWREDASGARVLETTPLDEYQALALVEHAIDAAYRQDHFVIVGRGGQVILRDLPGVLHVRLECPLEERILRVRNLAQFGGGDLHRQGNFQSPVEIRRAAQDLIEARDQASAAYLRHNYGVDWADPALYDLVINTRRLSLDLAVRVIVEAAHKLSEELAPV
jgi:cytidylate kinase